MKSFQSDGCCIAFNFIGMSDRGFELKKVAKLVDNLVDFYQVSRQMSTFSSVGAERNITFMIIWGCI